MKRFILGLGVCMYGMGIASAMEMGDEGLHQWRRSVEGYQSTGELARLDEYLAKLSKSEIDFAKHLEIFTSETIEEDFSPILTRACDYTKIVDACCRGMSNGYEKFPELNEPLDKKTLKSFMRKVNGNYIQWSNRLWRWIDECEKGCFLGRKKEISHWIWKELAYNLKDVWLLAGNRLYRIHEKKLQDIQEEVDKNPQLRVEGSGEPVNVAISFSHINIKGMKGIEGDMVEFDRWRCSAEKDLNIDELRDLDDRLRESLPQIFLTLCDKTLRDNINIYQEILPLLEGCDHAKFADVCCQAMLDRYAKILKDTLDYGDFIREVENNYTAWLTALFEVMREYEKFCVKKGLSFKKKVGYDDAWLLAGNRLYRAHQAVTHEVLGRMSESRYCLLNSLLNPSFRKLLVQQGQEQMHFPNQYESFLDAVTGVVIKKFGFPVSIANFDGKRRFLSEVEKLVIATRACYLPPEHGENKTLEFLRKKAEGEDCSEAGEMNVFFSHFHPDLLKDLYEGFSDWGSEEESKLKIVLLHGNPGTGKTASFLWLFEQQKDPNVAVIRANPGDSLVGSDSTPGIFDMLLIKNSYWRCINMWEELSLSSSSSLGALVSCLDLEGDRVVFRSPYFEVPVPIKNVVVACTSNCEKPADEKKGFPEDRVNYRKVKYGKFSQQYVEDTIRDMYITELNTRFHDRGQEVWDRIFASDQSSPSAYRRIRNAIERQINICDLGNMARQRVDAFIAEGGATEWL